MNKLQVTDTQPVTVQQAPSLLSLPPDQLIGQATHIASVLKSVITSRGLSQRIQGKEHVKIEGWSTLGSLLGITPREVDVRELKDGSYEATVELFNWKSNQVVGRASALCGKEERRWSKADRYAVRSMAITRATGKAYRLCFSWIITLAGYEPCPAEEMPPTIPQAPQNRYQKTPPPPSEVHNAAPPPPPSERAEMYDDNNDEHLVRLENLLKKKDVPAAHFELISDMLKGKPMMMSQIDDAIKTVAAAVPQQ